VVDARVVFPALGRGKAEQFSECGPPDGDVEPEHAGAVQVRGGVESRVVVDDDCGEREPPVGGVSPSGSWKKNESPQAGSGAPLSAPAVTATAPGRLVTNSMISSSVAPGRSFRSRMPISTYDLNRLIEPPVETLSPMSHRLPDQVSTRW
jgi:hypothetical protein